MQTGNPCYNRHMNSRIATSKIETYSSDLLGRDFYRGDAVSVAKGLLGKVLVSLSEGERTAGIIVETEAYAGRGDAACHSYKRAAPSPAHRTNAMFMDGGHAYIYLIYGMYNCFNVVANSVDEPEAVLIRALEPIDGLPLMARRRGTEDIKKLCSGPGKLCNALAITREQYGADLCAGGNLYITEGIEIPQGNILATPRINVDYAGEAALLPYRFVIRNSKFLSTKRFLKEANDRENST